MWCSTLSQMEDSKRNYRLGLVLVTVAAVAWSTSGLFTRFLVVDAATILFWRGFFGVFGTLALVPFLSGAGGYKAFSSLGWAGCAYAAVTGASMLFFISALLNTTVAHVAIITSVVPLMAAFLSWLVLREKPSVSSITASLVALVGVSMMVGVSSDGRLFGDVLALIMAVLMAGMILISRSYKGIPALPATCLASALSALVVLPFASVTAVSGDQLLILAVFALVNQVLGFGLFAIGARWLPPTQSALILALEAPLAPLWVWLVLTETPGQATLSGGAIVLLAVFGHIFWSGRRKK
jgi:drug/metabolite transporter (DMT)-like permease